MKPRLGIVLSSFERPIGLNSALLSIHEQTFEDFICVIADDHSENEDVHEIIDMWCKHDPRFIRLTGHKQYTDEMKGLRCSFSDHINKSMDWLDKVGVEFYSYLVDDVIYHPERCEKHIEFLDARSDIHLVWGEQWLIEHRDDGTIRRERKQIPEVDNWHEMKMPEIRDRMGRQNIINHCSATHRKYSVRWSLNPQHWQRIDHFLWRDLIDAGAIFAHIPIVGETMNSTPNDIGPMMVHKGATIVDIAKARRKK